MLNKAAGLLAFHRRRGNGRGGVRAARGVLPI